MKKAGMIPLILVLVACSANQSEGEVFGQGVNLDESVAPAVLFASAQDYNGQVVRVQGTITDMCKHKGCWMQIRDGEQVLTVRFQDEAFTIPLESMGRQVDVQGLFLAESAPQPLGTHSMDGESGCAAGEAGCEAERLAKSLNNFTMVSSGLVLL